MNGKDHLNGNIATAIAASAATAHYAPHALPGVAVGLALGIVAGPDVRDQQRVRNEGEWVVTRIFGRALGYLWTIYWWPLAAALPHRHALSHMPLLGTAVAMIYLLLPVLTLYWWLCCPGSGVVAIHREPGARSAGCADLCGLGGAGCCALGAGSSLGLPG